MVLCKFYLQGNCRFNTKCVNEHFDVKQIIKTDVETAINGQQWPLSTYGPFKDKPSIPNFIEDQSFEEIRMLCYEAKQKNFFDQFHQQFTKEALDANNKMKALLQMTPDIIDVVIKVYDMPSDISCSGAATGKTASTVMNNPFGTSNAGSIFAKSNTAIANNNNIFSNATATGGGFGGSSTPGKSIFGATTNNNPTSSSIFGNSTPFGGQQPQQQQQQSSIFGQATMSASSIFGGGTANNQQMNSIFGQQQSQTTAPTMGANIFASATQQQPQQQQPSQFGLFSQQNQQQPSIFGQQKQPEIQNTNIFTQTPQVAQPQAGLFAQAAQTMQQQQQQQPQGLFAQAVQQTAAGQGLFAQQTQSVFGQPMQQQPNTNIFQQQPRLNNVGQQQQHMQNMQAPTGLFQQATQQNQNPMATPSPAQVTTTVYSRMEDLTADEIEAFKADCFLPGKIPFRPPPRELIN